MRNREHSDEDFNGDASRQIVICRVCVLSCMFFVSLFVCLFVCFFVCVCIFVRCCFFSLLVDLWLFIFCLFVM